MDIFDESDQEYHIAEVSHQVVDVYQQEEVNGVEVPQPESEVEQEGIIVSEPSGEAYTSIHLNHFFGDSRNFNGEYYQAGPDFTSTPNTSPRTVRTGNVLAKTKFFQDLSGAHSRSTSLEDIPRTTRSSGPVSVSLTAIDKVDPSSRRRRRKINQKMAASMFKQTLESYQEVTKQLRIDVDTFEAETSLKAEQIRTLKEKLCKLEVYLDKVQKKQADIVKAQASEPADMADLKTVDRACIDEEADLKSAISRAKQMIASHSKIAASGKLAKIDIPNFFGGQQPYKLWRAQFNLLTQGYDETSRKMYLIEKLKGEAYRWVEDLILIEAPLADLWKALDDHFGNDKNIIDSTIRSFFVLERPTEEINKFEEHFIQSKNKGASILTLGHSTDELIAAYWMLQIPSKYRIEIERSLASTASKRESPHKYTFSDLTPMVEEVIRIHRNSASGTQEIPVKAVEVEAYKGLTKEVQQGEEPKTHQKPFQRNNGKGQQQQGSFRCYRCGKPGHMQVDCRSWRQNGFGATRKQEKTSYTCDICGQGHKTWFCRTYKHGAEMRAKLKSLNKCDVCALDKDKHGQSGSWILSSSSNK